MKKYILGVKIDDVTMKEAVETVALWMGKPGKRYIVTPNPEFIVAADKDQRFKKILNEADLSIPDGVGLNWFGGIKNRIPGVDFMEELVKLASQSGFTVGFLGGEKGVAEKTAEVLMLKYPKLKVTATISDLIVNKNGLILPPTDILFVAFGHGKQEKWIASNLRKIPVKVAMGVGGSFNYLSGRVPRAPKWIRELGLEWLFRLIIQPWRIKRQFSLVKFIWLILSSRT